MMRDGCIDLAAARVGGRALLASDEFFAPKENLLEPGRGVFLEGKYTDRGKWMDGWETRRRRGPGPDHDWCIIRLGIPGVIRAVTVDTNHFRGNHPVACSLHAAELRGAPTAQRLRALGHAFVELVPRSPLTGHAENDFLTGSDARCTHVRLNIYPDGGIARLRVWGEARPDWRRITSTERGAIDLVAVEHGGLPLARSEEHTSELQSRLHLVCRLLLEKKKRNKQRHATNSPHHKNSATCKSRPTHLYYCCLRHPPHLTNEKHTRARRESRLVYTPTHVH